MVRRYSRSSRMSSLKINRRMIRNCLMVVMKCKLERYFVISILEKKDLTVD